MTQLLFEGSEIKGQPGSLHIDFNSKRFMQKSDVSGSGSSLLATSSLLDRKRVVAVRRFTPATAETLTRNTMRAGARAWHKARLPSIKGYTKRYTKLGENFNLLF